MFITCLGAVGVIAESLGTRVHSKKIAEVEENVGGKGKKF
jgi:hypothetical protein